jgi:hypothetical protein
MTATLQLDIVTDASKAVSGFKKVDQAAASTATATQKSGSKIAGLAKAVATGFAVTKIVDFGKESVNVATSMEVANARLVKVYANAGDASGEAAKHAEDYADSLGKQIGVAPGVIEGAEGILGAFHSVNTVAGRQAGIMDGATKAAADQAAAGFGDLTSNAKTLGKALSDPAKGMAILKKSGVVLTTAQQAQIKSMEKQGNLLGAQKLLLGDVNKAVGGTAAATATSGAKMSVAFEEVQAKIGQKLLPEVNKIKAVLLGLISFVAGNANWLGPMAAAIGGVIIAVKLVEGVTKAWSAAQTIASGVTKAWTAVTKAARDMQLLFNMAMDLNPVVLIVAAIVILIGVIVLLVLKSKAFRDFWISVWGIVLNVVKAVWGWIQKNWPLLLGILLGPIALAAALIATHWHAILAAAQTAWAGVKYAAAVAYDYVIGIPGGIGRAFVSLFNIITGPFQSAWAWISRNVIGPLISGMAGIPGAIGRAFSGLFQTIIGPFEAAWNWISRNVVGPIGAAFGGFTHTVGSIKTMWNDVANTLNGVHIDIKIPSNVVTKFLHIDGKGFDWRWPAALRLPTLASGGVFDKATMAIVGEGAGTEIVTPERLLRQIVAEGGGNVTINVNVNVPPTANPAAAGRAVVDALRAYVRANGRIPGLAA